MATKETSENKLLRLEYRRLVKNVEDARHQLEMFLIDNSMWNQLRR